MPSPAARVIRVRGASSKANIAQASPRLAAVAAHCTAMLVLPQPAGANQKSAGTAIKPASGQRIEFGDAAGDWSPAAALIGSQQPRGGEKRLRPRLRSHNREILRDMPFPAASQFPFAGASSHIRAALCPC